ncbi:Copia protein, partial [Mucuna pruriens]
MKYLKGTKNYMLMYRQTDDLEVITYCDSGYVGYIDSRKSKSSYIFKLVNEAISCRSAKQILIVTSTMEVEFVSCFEAISYDFVDSISKPLKLYCDNLAAMFIAKNNKTIREFIKEKKVINEHVNTKLMIADLLTKGMSPKNFKDHMVRMGLGSIM